MNVKEAIEAINAKWNDSYNKRDAAGCASVYSDDCAMLAPNMPTIRGKEALQEFFQAWMDAAGGANSNRLVELGADGDLAYEIAAYSLTGTETPEDTGKFVQIFRRQPDGTWKTYLTIYNSDLPLPTGG